MERAKKRILIIDNDERDLVITKELLEHEGYEAITHRNGFGAIQAIRSAQPDLVLLDITMPGFSGDNIASIISFMNDRIALIPMVFYSSIDEDSLWERVMQYPVRGYICKGDIDKLREKVSYYLQRPIRASICRRPADNQA
jgi:two-component system response regulator RstA